MGISDAKSKQTSRIIANGPSYPRQRVTQYHGISNHGWRPCRADQPALLKTPVIPVHQAGYNENELMTNQQARQMTELRRNCGRQYQPSKSSAASEQRINRGSAEPHQYRELAKCFFELNRKRLAAIREVMASCVASSLSTLLRRIVKMAYVSLIASVINSSAYYMFINSVFQP
jgi:hypothetical protein